MYESDSNSSPTGIATGEFTRFTSESYQKLVERELSMKTHRIKRKRHEHEAHLVDGELRFGALEEEVIHPRENIELKEGNVFSKSFGKFPSSLLGVPIEELDPGIMDKTFVVINSRSRKKYINRFTATKSLFIFTPWNPVRRITLLLCTHQMFDVFIFFTIIVNCVFLTMPTMPIAEKMERVFLAIYTTELAVKVIGRGFILNPHTYMRDPWNWLDFIVILTSFAAVLSAGMLSSEVSSLDARGLRTFRVLRALKTVSILPGLKTIVSALLQAFKMFFEVIMLTSFCLMIFAIFGIQLYKGVLRNKCVINVAHYLSNPSESFDDYHIRWTRNSAHWHKDIENEYAVCGNNTGAGLCPHGYTCMPNLGDNPRYGFLNFDLFGWAALTSFQLIALDFWEDVYNHIIRATGPLNVIFFMVTTYLGSFYMINLMLAVVSTSYEEEAFRAGKEREREKNESARRKHNALYDVSYYHLKTKETKDSVSLITSAIEYKKSTVSNINENSKELGKMDMHSDITDDVFLPRNFRRVSYQTGSSGLDEESIRIEQANEILIVKADMLLDTEVGVLDGQVIDRNCDSCERWMCFYTQFLKIQNYFFAFVSDPLFDFMITVCIIINTFFMSLEHHNQSDLLTAVLNASDLVFAAIFIFEAFCKIMGLGKYYFVVGWNLFDLFTVVASVVDIIFSELDGLNVLRTFRLLRVLKLAKSWPTMRLLVTIILSTLGALGNLCLILCIIVYIFAVIGLQLFRDRFTVANFGDDIPRWNFTDFSHSMLMIFRVLCGEWIEPLYQCMRVSSDICIAVFLPALVFGNFIVLNLFLALLLNAFARESLERHLDTSEERSKLSEGWRRMKQLLFCGCITPGNSRNKSMSLDENRYRLDSDPMCVRSTFVVEDINQPSLAEIDIGADRSNNECNFLIRNQKDLFVSKNRNTSAFHEQSRHNNLVPSQVKEKSCSNQRYQETNQNLQDAFEDSRHSNQTSNLRSSQAHVTELRNSVLDRNTSNDVDSYVFNDEDDVGDQNDLAGPPRECLPLCLYQRVIDLDCCTSSPTWNQMRYIGKRIVDHPAFEAIVLGLIIASSVTLVFEDIYLQQKPELEHMLFFFNIFFAALFCIEMVLKWTGLGLLEYFTNFWTILDFFIVLVSMLSLVGDATGKQNIAAFRSLRTFRAFRPLRAVSRWHGMKIVVNALMNAIPAILNVFFVCMVFWLIFSIMGVQFFKGTFYRCLDSTANKYDYSIVHDEHDCYSKNGSWENMNINFDNAANGFLALFQVATFEGWMEIMAAAVDSQKKPGQQPKYEVCLHCYLYFVVFIVIGSFFSLNLFIGVIIDNFNVLKKRYEGSYLDAFLSHDQRNYYNTIKKMLKRKPKRIIRRPKIGFQLIFYDLATSSRFEISVVLLIFLNMMTMAICHYNQPLIIEEIYEMANIFFTCVFTLEAIVKIIGLRVHYFRLPWNVFDFIIVVFSIIVIFRPALNTFTLGAKMNDLILSHVIVMPSLLRIVRVFYIGRVLRLMKLAKGIRKLLFAIIISLPAVMNIGALLFLIMFIYAIIGMSSFGAVKINGVFTEIVNFQTFGNSFMLLLRLSTAAGWNDILDALLVAEPECNPKFYMTPGGVTRASVAGDCGIPYIAIPFMVSYIILVWLIVVNMYIAVLLENFNQAHVQEEVGITEDDFDMFYTMWEKYDPMASQFIKYEQLGELVAGLDPPLQIKKPNDIALVSFNIPILEGDKMHCIDILLALVKNVLGEGEDSGELRSLKLQLEAKFAQVFPARMNMTVTSTTMQRKKEDVAARTLQRSWRSFKAQKAMRDITDYAQRLKLLRSQMTSRRLPTAAMLSLSSRLDEALGKYFLQNVEPPISFRKSFRSILSF